MKIVIMLNRIMIYNKTYVFLAQTLKAYPQPSIYNSNDYSTPNPIELTNHSKGKVYSVKNSPFINRVTLHMFIYMKSNLTMTFK